MKGRARGKHQARCVVIDGTLVRGNGKEPTERDREAIAMMRAELERRDAIAAVKRGYRHAGGGDITDEQAAALLDVINRRCVICGCTDKDCSGCIERTGRPCSWVNPDDDPDELVCSACVTNALDKAVGPGNWKMIESPPFLLDGVAEGYYEGDGWP